jgi:hypothetical protein
MAKLASTMTGAEESLFSQFTYLSELQLGVERLDKHIRESREYVHSIQKSTEVTDALSAKARQVHQAFAQPWPGLSIVKFQPSNLLQLLYPSLGDLIQDYRTRSV